MPRPPTLPARDAAEGLSGYLDSTIRLGKLFEAADKNEMDVTLNNHPGLKAALLRRLGEAGDIIKGIREQVDRSSKIDTVDPKDLDGILKTRTNEERLSPDVYFMPGSFNEKFPNMAGKDFRLLQKSDQLHPKLAEYFGLVQKNNEYIVKIKGLIGKDAYGKLPRSAVIKKSQASLPKNEEIDPDSGKNGIQELEKQKLEVNKPSATQKPPEKVLGKSFRPPRNTNPTRPAALMTPGPLKPPIVSEIPRSPSMSVGGKGSAEIKGRSDGDQGNFWNLRKPG